MAANSQPMKKNPAMTSRRCLLALLILGAMPLGLHAAPFMFGRPVQIVDNRGDEVAVGDFNGDGRDDLAILREQRYIDVFMQQEDNTLAWSTRVSFPTIIWGIEAANLGNDAAHELLLGHDGGLVVYAWNGINAFARKDFPSDYTCQGIVTGDVDGDGTQDVICGSLDQQDAAMYFGNATTMLSSPSYMRTIAGPGKLRDVNGDGRLDLLTGNHNTFYVYPHDGKRGFLPAVAYTRPVDVHADFPDVEAVQLDGGTELVVTGGCNMPCAVLYHYRRGANGYFELVERRPTMDNPNSLRAVDLDKDGRQDLLVGHDGWMTMGRYMGRGTRLSATELWTPLNLKYTRQVAMGDLNDDGHVDLVLANGVVQVYHGGLQARDDFDSNLSSDLLWRGAAGELMIWWTANSASPRTLDPVGADWVVQATGDFDGDGDAEMFLRNRVTGANSMRTSYGSEMEPTPTIASQDWQVVGEGDFDGDGRMDILWRNSRTGANTVWRSASSLTWQSLAVLDLAWKMAGIGDITGDGSADIVWRNTSTGANMLWPSGRKDLQQPLAGVASQQWSVAAVGDFNADGKDDLVWRNAGTGANDLWYSGSLASRVPLAAAPLAWAIATVGDYNRDGRADLVWRNAGTGANTIWHGADAKNARTLGSLAGWQIVN